MATEFLVTLYEYSPLFYIFVVITCFAVTTGLLLGWYRFDVPVILRNSEETISAIAVRKKHMVQVKNPFALEIANPSDSSIPAGIKLQTNCIEDCILTCYWGCSVQKLHEALQKHTTCSRITTPQKLEDVLDTDFIHMEQFLVGKVSRNEHCCRLPEDAGIKDFGPIPRTLYPLVTLLTLSSKDKREIYEIVSCITVIHIPDEKYRLCSQVLHHYLLTEHGQVYDLKQLFMSADTEVLGSDMAPSVDKNLLDKFGPIDDETEANEGHSKDCIVCQNAEVNWVLLPCRHTCLCDGCVKYFQQCPVCRQFIQESFVLSNQ
ncbi:cell growth regulator with RING finger domain protein 1 isoform X1 [Protopterus annectens]|uniref:cell growth regulator with RING finger domain protein 1 isoform X1 n=1 Tax=Protopterus annectens TaxID=7888 RepID=UPI001CF96AC9|nr:cell growth regulator with RING finger domain protein 1 isoform X1 [Protopterus annectens]